MTRTGSIGLMVCALAAALVLGGCRENEQDRVLRFQKGQYSGKPDTELSAGKREELRDRIRFQGGLGGVDHGPPGGAVLSSGGSDVRLPGGEDALRSRGAGQSGR